MCLHNLEIEAGYMSRTGDELGEELATLRAKREALEGPPPEAVEQAIEQERAKRAARETPSAEVPDTKPGSIAEAAERAIKEQIEKEKRRIERLERTPSHRSAERLRASCADLPRTRPNRSST